MSGFRPFLLLFAALLAAACGGSGTGPENRFPLIGVGMARLDRSPLDQRTGMLAFFYDPNTPQRLLDASVVIRDVPLDQPPIQPGIVPGPIYWNWPGINPNEAYGMTASVQAPGGTINVQSSSVVVPASFEIHAPAQHPRAQPLTITWDPVPNAQKFNIVVVQSNFEAEVPGTATSFTIPPSALANLTSSEIEVTAYNGFYVSLNVGINSLHDAETAAQRFTEAENLTGMRGSFGASNTAGVVVQFQ